MGRLRSAKNRNLEPNVRVNKAGYVTYKHKLMDTYESFGKDIEAANEVARIINKELSGQAARVKRILSRKSKNDPLPLFSEVINRFIEERVPGLNWGKHTLEQHTYKLNNMTEYAGHHIYEDTDVLFFAEMIDHLYGGSTRRSAVTLCRQIDTFAVGKGLRRGPNVCNGVMKPAKTPRKRQRIKTYEDYLKIRECAEPWLQDAMDIALITLQPRQVLCSMNMGMISDNKLRVKREKTGAYIEIEIGESLKPIFARRRIQAIRLGTRRIICRPAQRMNRVEVRPAKLTDAFTQAVSDSGLYKSNAPTLHELRSLGGWMY